MPAVQCVQLRGSLAYMVVLKHKKMQLLRGLLHYSIATIEETYNLRASHVHIMNNSRIYIKTGNIM